MQLTRFDRWLRVKFVYETHIHTLSQPETLPRGVRSLPPSERPGQQYKFHYITTNSKAADALISQLKENAQMYTTRIVDRNAWYVPFIAPKDKSFTWRLVSAVLSVSSAFYILHFVKGLIESPEFQKNFAEALKILQG